MTEQARVIDPVRERCRIRLREFLAAVPDEVIRERLIYPERADESDEVRAARAAVGHLHLLGTDTEPGLFYAGKWVAWDYVRKLNGTIVGTIVVTETGDESEGEIRG